MVVARTLQCGRLLPLLRPNPSRASRTQGGSAAGEKVAASRRIPNTAHRRSDGTSLNVGHYKIAGAGTCEDSQSKTTSSLLNHSEVPTDARPNVVCRICGCSAFLCSPLSPVQLKKRNTGFASLYRRSQGHSRCRFHCHHQEMANHLLQAGMGKAAPEKGRKAVELEPKSALAQKTLAEILEFDSVGRKMPPGTDFAAAAKTSVAS